MGTGQKQRQPYREPHGGGADKGLPERDPAAHGPDAVGPQQQIEHHHGHHAVDDRLFPQDGQKEGKAHKAVVPKDHGEAHGPPAAWVLPAKAEQGHGRAEQGGQGIDRREFQQEPDHAVGALDGEGVDDDAGGDHVEDPGGHLGDPVGIQLPQLGQDKAHPHEEKQRDHLSGHQSKI